MVLDGWADLGPHLPVRGDPARRPRARCSCARSRWACPPASSRGTCRCSSWRSSSVPPWPPGRPMILKPSPETPLDSYILGEILDEIELPKGMVSILPAGREVGEYLVRHPGVDKVGFTGSTAAGRKVGAICGELLKRCTLELGGKSAAIILDDADLGATHPDAHAQLVHEQRPGLRRPDPHPRPAVPLRRGGRGARRGREGPRRSATPPTRRSPSARWSPSASATACWATSTRARPRAPSSSSAAAARPTRRRAGSSSRPCSSTSTTR